MTLVPSDKARAKRQDATPAILAVEETLAKKTIPRRQAGHSRRGTAKGKAQPPWLLGLLALGMLVAVVSVVGAVFWVANRRDQRAGSVHEKPPEPARQATDPRAGQAAPSGASAAVRLVYGVQPTNTVAGTAISPSVQIRVEDAFGNPITTDTSHVTIAIGSNPAGGTLRGTLTVPAVNGIARFSDLSIDKAGAAYTLTASSGKLTSAVSATFAITAPVSPTDWAVYLGCGPVGGPGTVVQLDRTGNVLGTVQLPGTPYGLAMDRDSLVAAIPSGSPGKIIRIDNKGKGNTILEDGRTIPSPIAVAVDPVSGDILVADNNTDVLLLLPAGQPSKATRLFQIKGYEGTAQAMSLAFARDGFFLFGGSGPQGIYRFRAVRPVNLGRPILPDDGKVAADPTSARWAVALRKELRVFEETREIQKLSYPGGARLGHLPMAFGTDGSLVLALTGDKSDVVIADLDAKTFRSLFGWTKSRVVCLAVGPKMSWDTTKVAALESPRHLAPAEESVFNHFPRKTTLRWAPVAGAVKYRVEIAFQSPPRTGQWKNRKPVETGETEWTFNFVGAQPGRWRVWAVDAGGVEGPKSEWWTFRYTK